MRFLITLLIVFMFSKLLVCQGTTLTETPIGTAPMAVFFDVLDDASGVIQPETVNGRKEYADLSYHWDFGDNTNDVWPGSSKQKNEDIGYVASHVYETPGVYTVTLTVKISNDVSHTYTQEITVQDPDNVYAGNKTICISSTGNFAGAPAGALLITTTDITDMESYVDTGKRILLCRGDTWTSSHRVSFRFIDGPAHIGAYGEGINPDEHGIYENAPRINVTGTFSSAFFALNNSKNITISDLHLVGDHTYSSAAGGAINIEDILLNKLHIEGFNVPVSFSHYMTAGLDRIMLINSHIHDAKGNIVYLGSERLVVMGNSIYNSNTTHVLRVWQAYKGVIGHNILHGSSITNHTGRHALKLHGPSEDLIYSDGNSHLDYRTQYVVLHDNIFGACGPWPVVVAPQNMIKDERIQDVLIDGNKFLTGYGTTSPLSAKVSTQLRIIANYVTVRNNIFDGNGNGKDCQAVVVHPSNHVPSVGNRIYNNTSFRDDCTSNGFLRFARLYAGCENNIVQNNILSRGASLPHSITMVFDQATDSEIGNNLIVEDLSCFVDPQNINVLERDLRLLSGSAPIDAGVAVANYYDHDLQSRPKGASIDIGAYEFDPTNTIEPQEMSLTEISSGTAPFAVFFDAIDPASALVQPETVNGRKEYADFSYHWDFGDNTNDVWQVSSKSKNEDIGYLASHVYENPGVYTVTLTVKTSNAQIQTYTQEITVQDPDLVYAGNKTICISSTGDFSGAPTGALQITSTDITDINNYIEDGKRILLRRGDVWTTTERIYLGWLDGPVHIGAYGEGINPDEQGIYENAPRINATGTYSSNLFTFRDANNVTVSDLHLVGDFTYSSAAGGPINNKDILLYKLHIEGFNTTISFASYMTDGHDRIMLIDSHIHDANGNIVFIGSERLVLMGNFIYHSNMTHVVRVWQAYKGVIGHNILHGSSITNHTGRLALKLHGPSEDLINSTGPDHVDHRTRYVVIHDNLFGACGPWPVNIGPQNNVQDERIQDILVDGNKFITEYGTLSELSAPVSTPLRIMASYVTVRNNVFDGNGSGKDYQAIFILPSIHLPSVGNRIFNNTVFRNDCTNDGFLRFSRLNAGCENTIIRNNLLARGASSPSSITMVYDQAANTVLSNNMIIDDLSSFIDPLHVNVLERDLRLLSGSAPIDAGISVANYYDHDLQPRPMGASIDIGAYEFDPINTLISNEIMSSNITNKISNELECNIYPNPFNSTTTIEYAVSEISKVEIIIYDAFGKKVKQLFDKVQTPGIYKVYFDGSTLDSGLYYCSLQLNSTIVAMQKLMLVK